MGSNMDNKEKSMYKIIADIDKIKENQKIILEILKSGKVIMVNDQRLKHNNKYFNDIRHDVYWLPQLMYWSAYYNDDKMPIMNIFGLTEPKDNKELTITVEINFSLKGGNTGGVLVEGDNNKIILAHNGNIRISGKTSQESKDYFINYYKKYHKDKCVDINIGKKTKKIIIIGEIPSEKSQYIEFQEKLHDFINEVDKIKKKNQTKDKNANNPSPPKNVKMTTTIKKKKQSNGDAIPESSFEIAQKCEKLIRKINKIKIIFNGNNTDEWLIIREPVNSEADFFWSINKLCIVVKEDTRDKNLNFKPGKRNGPYYNYRFPDNARKIELFKEDVENIRNYENHKKNEIKKIKYMEICKKYLDFKREPVEEEEFKKFQLSILSEFEASLKELLDILLKKDKNKSISPLKTLKSPKI
jgi:hypothetical protein